MCYAYNFSLRAKYGSDTVQNAVHAADSHETAVR